MLNYDGTVGAVGRRAALYAHGCFPPAWCASTSPRKCRCAGRDGFCIECAPGRSGRSDRARFPSKAGRTFDGYTGEADTQKKILRDVFEKGDAWFRTGDLMRQDKHGYFYFVDRVGDTFRWKGENVATSEVARR